MKDMFKSKVMWLFIIFVLGVVYFDTNAQKNVSKVSTDNMLNNYEINQHH
ncbi:MAG: hypothetical protein V8Q71_00035 [Bacilli bacterium]